MWPGASRDPELLRAAGNKAILDSLRRQATGSSPRWASSNPKLHNDHSLDLDVRYTAKQVVRACCINRMKMNSDCRRGMTAPTAGKDHRTFPLCKGLWQIVECVHPD